ncbi:MAG: GNAT family N-acetyltransferase [Opitutales bacterium]
MPVHIRNCTPADHAAVSEVVTAAFEQPDEANLIRAVRDACDPNKLLELVLETEAGVVGHILFSPVTIGKKREKPVEGMGLGPVAVHPDHQRGGRGSALIRLGLMKLKQRDCSFAVVLGDPAFYARFGFEPAEPRGITCLWEDAGPAFQVLELTPGGLDEVTGLARYRPEFAVFG